MTDLPLFPLGTVLVPGMVLPLRVFEPRYVRLLHDLGVLEASMAQDPSALPGFGVVAIRQGHEVGADQAVALHPVGCEARFLRVHVGDAPPHGVVVVGARRFRIDLLDDHADDPYLTARISWLDEPVGDPGRVVALATEVATALRERMAADLTVPTDPTELSYALGAAPLSVGLRQRLLAAPTTEDRLDLVARLLRGDADGDHDGSVARGPAGPGLN